MSKGKNVELTFEGLIPDSAIDANASNYDGYGGFDFIDVELLTKHGIRHFDWLDTGFSNVLHGDCDAFTLGYGPAANTYGWLKPANAGETFDLKSGIFASGYREPLVVRFWTFNANGSFHGELTLGLTQTADKVDFAKYGNKFRNIAELYISSYSPYGAHGFFPVAMDNIRVHWNTPHSGTNRKPVFPAWHHGLHPHICHVPTDANRPDGQSGTEPSSLPWFHHSELLSLAAALRHADPGGGLTDQFSLPHADCFGV